MLKRLLTPALQYTEYDYNRITVLLMFNNIRFSARAELCLPLCNADRVSLLYWLTCRMSITEVLTLRRGNVYE